MSGKNDKLTKAPRIVPEIITVRLLRSTTYKKKEKVCLDDVEFSEDYRINNIKGNTIIMLSILK